MHKRLKIGFIWQGVSVPAIRDHWQDGLWAALQIIKESHDVHYFEPWQDVSGMDVLLYWEAPTTINGGDAENYKRVMNMPQRKALLFAGGPLKKEWVEGFDHVFVESKINADECQELGIPHSTAFGINDRIFKPQPKQKVFDGMHQGTCASWKRQWLLAEALRDKALLCGRFQESDPRPFTEAKKHGAVILPEMSHYAVCELLNASWTMVQTSDYWGGGQRATLEAMACGIPVICMEDSPKNREYVEESGFGEVVPPSKEQILLAVERIKSNPPDPQIGVNYVKSKWTANHYAESLLRWLSQYQ